MNIIKQLCTARAIKNRIADSRLRMYRVAVAWCRDTSLADDLVNESIAIALEKYKQLKDPTRLDSWMYSILNNCWRQYLRNRKQDDDIDSHTLRNTCCPEHVNLYSELAMKVFDLMEALPDGQRQTLSLITLEGLSYREVADSLDVPIGTVMSRLARARKFIDGQLTDEQPQRTSKQTSFNTTHIKRVK